jgi:hypothetical protein
MAEIGANPLFGSSRFQNERRCEITTCFDELMRLFQEDEDDVEKRLSAVLGMLEFVLEHPFNCSLGEKQISAISSCIEEIRPQLGKQPVMMKRISKIWKRRQHLLDVARYVHRHHEDYMDSIEYHQEVQWLKIQRRLLFHR